MNKHDVELELLHRLTRIPAPLEKEIIKSCADGGRDRHEAMHKTAIRLTERLSRLGPEMIDLLAWVREQAVSPLDELRDATR